MCVYCVARNYMANGQCNAQLIANNVIINVIAATSSATNNGARIFLQRVSRQPSNLVMAATSMAHLVIGGMRPRSGNGSGVTNN